MKLKRLLIAGAVILLFAGLILPQAYRGKGRIKGSIKDTDGNPVPGVTVKLFHVKSDSGFELKSDEQGQWSGAWLRNGLWYLDFEKEGYIPKRLSLDLHEGGKNPDVEVALKKARAPLVPQEVLDQLDKGNGLYSQGKFEEAIAEFKSILDKRPEFYQININIGNALMKKEDYASALCSYQKVLDKDPANAEALISAGNCYVELKDFPKALEAFKKIDKADITDPVVLFNIGTIFTNNGETDKAIEYYSQSLVVKSDFLDSYYQLGLAYLGRNDKPKALEAFQKYLELDNASEKADQVRKFIDYLGKN